MKVKIKVRNKIKAGPGIAVANADANMIISATGVAAAGYTEGAAVDALMSDSKIGKVVRHSTYATPTAFPTILKAVDGTKSITLDSTGIVMTDSATGKSFTVAFSSLTQNVALRADDYCDGTTDKSQMHLASVPYV